MLLKTIGTVFLFFVLLSANSQTSLRKSGTAYFDSLKKQKPSIKPAGDFDQRFSLIHNNNKQVNIWGYRIGVLINDRIKAGIGGYTLKANFDSNITKLRNLTNVTQVNQTLYYGTIYLEPYLIRRKRWEMSMVFEMGYGNAIIDSTKVIRTLGRRPTTTTKLTTSREPFFPIGMGLSANFIIPDIKGFHFLTYLGLNGMFGMRMVILESDFKENYNGFYWSIGSAIYIDRIFSDISNKKKKKKAAPL
jgi:hypothetical protein